MGFAVAVGDAVADADALGVGAAAVPPQAATTLHYLPPLNVASRGRGHGRNVRILGPLARCAVSSGQHAPEDVTDEHDIQAASKHERGERQRVVSSADPQLNIDDER